MYMRSLARWTVHNTCQGMGEGEGQPSKHDDLFTPYMHMTAAYGVKLMSMGLMHWTLTRSGTDRLKNSFKLP